MTQRGCSLNLLCTSIDYQMRTFCIAPELAYEKVEDNVRREVEKLGLSYLVVLFEYSMEVLTDPTASRPIGAALPDSTAADSRKVCCGALSKRLRAAAIELHSHHQLSFLDVGDRTKLNRLLKGNHATCRRPEPSAIFPVLEQLGRRV